jgi:hypothetical protein
MGNKVFSFLFVARTADGELVFGTGETETLSMNFNVKARRRGAWASIVATARA